MTQIRPGPARPGATRQIRPIAAPKRQPKGFGVTVHHDRPLTEAEVIAIFAHPQINATTKAMLDGVAQQYAEQGVKQGMKLGVPIGAKAALVIQPFPVRVVEMPDKRLVLDAAGKAIGATDA